ncbi:opacity protein-like surface antigen [Brevundimonas alba]|uniref:Opacity protein-like surface antigen n=2 Tax=Brevundimonas alba TaxID=74314 RepID=A0A7X5YGZ5_9CAUL|nr:opacity protein-like surface antigen [Brevundimonas alba]
MAGSASAQNYFQANLGATVSSSTDLSGSLVDGPDNLTADEEFDIDRGLFVSGAFGRDNGMMRFEGEVLYSNGDLEDTIVTDGADTYDLGEVSVSQAAVMLNVLFDLGSSERFQPYIGAGVGYGATRFEAPDLDEDEVGTGVAWQVKAGVTIKASETMSWDIGYRYFRGADFDAAYSEPGFAYELEAETTSHAVTVGARFSF